MPTTKYTLYFLLCSCLSYSQSDLVYDNHTYLPHIKSARLHHAGLETSLPIVDLNSSGQLKLSFDDILGGDRNYTYKVIHCDKDWNPSDIDEMEYLNGFNNEEIDNYDYSRGTIIDYTNYWLTLPNDDTGWRISGNYLLVITDDDSDELAISKRFMVVDSKVSVRAQTVRPVRANKVRTHQEIQMVVNHKDFRIQNPQREIYVDILQNGRWDNALTNIQPRFVTGFDMNFDVTDQNIFPALKEFRGVDLRSIRSRGFGVHSIDRYSDRIDVLLQLEQSRLGKSIFDYNDVNGSYIIESLQDDNFDTESDYVDAYFALHSRDELLDAEVFVVGSMTDWNLTEENKMRYDWDNQLYITGLTLKQGYYDYQYVLKKEGITDYQYFEGSDFSTENQYNILVYLRSFNGRYDQLIGATSILSDRK